MRWVLCVVENHLPGDAYFGIGGGIAAAVKIAIETRKIAARDLYTDVMAGLK